MPLLFMFWKSVQIDGGFWVSCVNGLSSLSLWQGFENSLKVAFFVASFSVVLGVMLGIILLKTTLLFRYVFLAILITPLLLPPYIVAYGWFELLGREGVLGELLFGFWGTSFVLFWVYLPIPLLLSWLFLKQVNPKLEESALLLTDWRRVLFGVTLPLLQPAIGFAFILVFILAFGEFSVANFFHYPIFPMESFTYFSAFYDFKMATITAFPMIFLVLLVLVIDRYLKQKGLRFHQAYTIKIIELHRLQYPLLLLLFIFTIVVTLPFLTLFIKSDLTAFLMALEKANAPLLRSIFYAVVGATLLMLIGFLGAYGLEEHVIHKRNLFEGLLLFLFVVPSTVLGIGMIFFWNSSWGSWMYGTPLIIFLGYLSKYLFLSMKIAQIRLSQIPFSMVESAQLLGASWYQILKRVLIPLSKESLLLIWIMGFIFSLRESTITMLVYPAGSDTLPLYIFTQMANGNPAMVASLCLIMMFVTFFPLLGFFLWRNRA